MRNEALLETLAQFQQSRKEKYGIIRIGIFGSAVRENAAEYEDVDIVVEIAEPDLMTMVGIKQELEELLQRPVDVVRFRDTMNPFLKQRIVRDAVYV